MNPRAVIATGLTEGQINQLSSKGLRVVARSTAANAPIVKFALPRRVSGSEARRLIADVNSLAVSDVDTFYYPDEGKSGCRGADCALSLIKWQSPRTCGGQLQIGMIDTGIDLQHESLRDQDVEVVALAPSPSSSGPDHGTAIAALLVGRSGSGASGLLPGAKLLAINAFTVHEGEDRADVLRIVAALDELRRRGVKVVNLSFSGPPNEVLKRAINAALGEGMTLVAAAGNNGPGGAPSYPAAYPGVLAVTAVDSDMRIYKRSTRGDYITLAAPGVGITTAAAGGGEVIRSGTSFAAPFVTAALARLMSNDPTTGSARLESQLSSAARDLGAPGRDEVFGWGLVQADGSCTATEPDVARNTNLDLPDLPRE